MSEIRLYQEDASDIAVPASNGKTLFLDSDNVLKSKDSSSNVRVIEAVPSDAVPLSLGTPTPGTSGEFARRGHVHGHGNQGGGSLHSVATTTSSGFMSSSDKQFMLGLQGQLDSPGQALAIRTVTVDTTAMASDYTLLCDASAAPLVITLPMASSGTRILNIKKIDASANAVTIDGDGSEQIEGSSTASVFVQYENITIHSDGASNWYIL